MFRTVSNKCFRGEVEQEVIHWLCAAVWNPFEYHKDYLDRDLAYRYMRNQNYIEEVFQQYYSGWFVLNELKIERDPFLSISYMFNYRFVQQRLA
jgi:hypothetical protein